MDQKQFERLQDGVQWVMDEKRLREEGVTSARTHNQRRWALGTAMKEWITAKPRYEGDVHNQVNVVCATACCLAGNIVSANGDTFISWMDEATIDAYAASGEELNVEYCLTADGNEIERVGTRAMKLAGLTSTEADELFHEGNTATDIVRRATAIATKHGYELTVI